VAEAEAAAGEHSLPPAVWPGDAAQRVGHVLLVSLVVTGEQQETGRAAAQAGQDARQFRFVEVQQHSEREDRLGAARYSLADVSLVAGQTGGERQRVRAYVVPGRVYPRVEQFRDEEALRAADIDR
jgi:hypothetical protein